MHHIFIPSKLTIGMRTERWLKKRPPEEPLDYSPSSGPVAASERSIEQYSTGPYPWGNHHTSFDTADTDGEVATTGDAGDVEWQSLQKRNKRTGVNTTRQDNNDRGRYNDFCMMIDQLEELPQNTADKLLSQSLSLYQSYKHSREDGFKFGGEWPIEVTEIALITIAARHCIEQSGVDELDMDNPLHDLAFNGDLVTQLCDMFEPHDKELTTDKVKGLRRRLLRGE